MEMSSPNVSYIDIAQTTEADFVPLFPEQAWGEYLMTSLK